MPVTTTEVTTIAKAANQADPNSIADVLRLMKLGRMLDPVKLTLTGLPASATLDITSLDKGGSGVAINLGLADLVTGQAIPPILDVKTVRVTAGAAAAGARFMTDAGGAASATVALISDDGKTLTFEGTVTALVLEYVPRSSTPLTDALTPVS